MKRSSGAAFWIAMGILSSRISGLFRERVFAYYLGNSLAADAFRAAQRIPNFLQTLLGEGALSASFIPAYSRLLAQGNEKDATKLAGIIVSLLAVGISIFVLIGVVASPFLTTLIAPGFSESTRDLTIRMVRISFPGIGILALSAWCLGVLNSHRKFFLPYVAPVLMNATIILTLVLFGNSSQDKIIIYATWGATIGSFLVFAIQLPVVLILIKKLQLSFDIVFIPAREVIKNFLPAVLARGVVQISSYIDSIIASWLPASAVSSLSYAQIIYTLPVSLFGISISAAELPELSSELGEIEEVSAKLRQRLNAGLSKIAFFVIPSVGAFVALGDTIVAALYQTGKFRHSDTIYVWSILIGSTVGLLAVTLGRLYASTFYALRDTRTPLKFSLIRLFLTIVLGYFCALSLPSLLNIPAQFGVIGLTASAGISGWIEFLLLRYYLNHKIGKTGIPFGLLAKLWIITFISAGISFVIKSYLPIFHPWLSACIVLFPYGLIYLILAAILNIPEATIIRKRFDKYF